MKSNDPKTNGPSKIGQTEGFGSSAGVLHIEWRAAIKPMLLISKVPASRTAHRPLTLFGMLAQAVETSTGLLAIWRLRQ